METDSCRASFRINDNERELCGEPAIACDVNNEDPVCATHTHEAMSEEERYWRRLYEAEAGLKVGARAVCHNAIIARSKTRRYNEEEHLDCLDPDYCADTDLLTEAGHHDGCCCYECQCYYWSLK